MVGALDKRRSLPTSVTRVRFQYSASHVGSVCCWFSSSLLLPSQKPTLQIPTSNGLNTNPWLGRLGDHSQCFSTFNKVPSHLLQEIVLNTEFSHNPTSCTALIFMVDKQRLSKGEILFPIKYQYRPRLNTMGLYFQTCVCYPRTGITVSY